MVKVPHEYTTSSPNNLFTFIPITNILSINDVVNPSKNHSGAFFIMGLSANN